MSPRTAWTIRIGAVLASAPICYLALVTIDSRSPWLLTAVIPVGFVLGEIVRRLTASSLTVKDTGDPDSGR